MPPVPSFTLSSDDFLRGIRQLQSGETAHLEDLYDVALKMPAMPRAFSMLPGILVDLLLWRGWLRSRTSGFGTIAAAWKSP